MERQALSFPDVSQFKDEKEFYHAAVSASAFKKVIGELLGWIDQRINEAQFLQKKEKGEVNKDFRIGGDI